MKRVNTFKRISYILIHSIKIYIFRELKIIQHDDVPFHDIVQLASIIHENAPFCKICSDKFTKRNFFVDMRTINIHVTWFKF